MAQDELRSKAREIDSLFRALIADVIEVTGIWQQRGDELSHRLYVRTVFSAVEGIIQVMKAGALLFDELNEPRLLSPEDIALLNEIDPQISGSGQIQIKKKKISLLPNFEYAIYTYARVRRMNVVLDKGGEGWTALREAIGVRDRLTHPHKVADLEVGLDELKTIEAAMKFFRDTTGQLLLQQ